LTGGIDSRVFAAQTVVSLALTPRRAPAGFGARLLESTEHPQHFRIGFCSTVSRKAAVTADSRLLLTCANPVHTDPSNLSGKRAAWFGDAQQSR